MTPVRARSSVARRASANTPAAILVFIFGGQDQAANIVDGVLLLIPFVMLSRTVVLDVRRGV